MDLDGVDKGKFGRLVRRMAFYLGILRFYICVTLLSSNYDRGRFPTRVVCET